MKHPCFKLAALIVLLAPAANKAAQIEPCSSDLFERVLAPCNAPAFDAFETGATPNFANTAAGPRQVAYSPLYPSSPSGSGSEGTEEIEKLYVAVANLDDNGRGSITVYSVDRPTGCLTPLAGSPFVTGDVPCDDCLGNEGLDTIAVDFWPLSPMIIATNSRSGSATVFELDINTDTITRIQVISNGLSSPVSLDFVPSTEFTGFFNLAIANLDGTVATYELTEDDNFVRLQFPSPFVNTNLAGDVSPFPFTRSVAAYPGRTVGSEAGSFGSETFAGDFLATANNNSLIAEVSLLEHLDVIPRFPNGGYVPAQIFDVGNQGNQDYPTQLSFSPDGNHLAVALKESVSVSSFDPVAQTLTEVAGSPYPVPSTTTAFAGTRWVAYSPECDLLATANFNCSVSIFEADPTTGELSDRCELIIGNINGGDNQSFSVAFSPDGCYLAVTNRSDNSVTVFKRLVHAIDQSFHVQENCPREGQLEAEAAGAKSLIFTLIDPPAHGTLVLIPDGSFVYTPDEDFVGNDSFTYQVCLGLIGCGSDNTCCSCDEGVATLRVRAPLCDFVNRPRQSNGPVSSIPFCR